MGKGEKDSGAVDLFDGFGFGGLGSGVVVGCGPGLLGLDQVAVKFGWDLPCAGEYFAELADDCGMFGEAEVFADEIGFGDVEHGVVGAGNGDVMEILVAEKLGSADVFLGLLQEELLFGGHRFMDL